MQKKKYLSPMYDVSYIYVEDRLVISSANFSGQEDPESLYPQVDDWDLNSSQETNRNFEL